MIRELFKDLIKYFPAKVVPGIIEIIAVLIITRLFAPADYGNYVLVMAMVSVLSVIAIAWLSASAIRFYPEYKLSNRLAESYSTFIKLTFISIGVICFIFLGVLSFAQSHISDRIYSLMWIGLLVFIVTSCSMALLSLLRARRQVGWYTSFSMWQSIAGLGFGMTLVLIFHFGVEGLLWGTLLSMIVALPLLWRISLGKSSLREGSARSLMTLEMAKYGFPVMMINLLTWMLSLSDRYILEFFRGSQEVGIYSASYNISERSIFLIVSLFSLSSIPIAFSIWESQGVKATQEFMSKLARYYLLICLPAVVGLSLLAKPIIGILVAPEYYLGYRIVPIVGFGAFLVGISNVFSEGITFHKRTDLLMFCYLGSGLLNIGLNFIFIPKYGYMGAAATTFISYAFLLLSMIFVSGRFFVWRFPIKSLAKAACASIGMGVAVYYVNDSLASSSLINLILSVSVGTIIYFSLLFLLQEIQPNEKRAMKQILEKHLPDRLIPDSWKVQG